jgi:galactokinase
MSLFEHQVVATLAAHNFFAMSKTIHVARAPGRLDVMGGNVDYTGGLVLQSLLAESIWVAAQPRTDGLIRILNPGAVKFGWEPSLQAEMEALDDLQKLQQLCEQRIGSRWFGYVLGALYFLKQNIAHDNLCGIDIFIASDLPPNKGVSSSAALEVAALKAASAVWGASLKGVALAIAGQWVENVVVGAACGIMDQAAIVLGQEKYLLPILCQPCLPAAAVKLPAGISIWGIDSMASRSTTGLAYETARAAALMGYKLLCQHEKIEVVPEELSAISRFTDRRWNGYLSNLAPSEFRSRYERLLPESLSGREFQERAGEHADPFTRIDLDREYPIRAAVRYATEENFRVQMFHTLLKALSSNGSHHLLQLMGEVLCQSHAAYTDCGLGSDACDELVSRALKAGFAGAKMTGGGAGGVVAILGRSGPEGLDSVHRIARQYGAARNATPYIFEGSSSGADAFGVRTVQLAPLQGAR